MKSSLTALVLICALALGIALGLATRYAVAAHTQAQDDRGRLNRLDTRVCHIEAQLNSTPPICQGDDQ